MTSEEETTHFGFSSIPKGEKAGRVQSVFEGVSDRYDLMNDLMSGGMHRIWKTALVDWLAPRREQRILDLAGGTGDIALKIARRRPEAFVTVLDLTENMLAKGRERARRVGLGERIAWTAGSADAMPFASGSFDACSVAFGVRNFSDIHKALSEIHRVLKPGGRLIVLEFGHVDQSALRDLYDRYSFAVIPRLGQLVLNDPGSYRYLVESIRQFPRRSEFSKMIEASGFSNVAVRQLAFGVAALHSAWKV